MRYTTARPNVDYRNFTAVKRKRMDRTLYYQKNCLLFQVEQITLLQHYLPKLVLLIIMWTFRTSLMLIKLS